MFRKMDDYAREEVLINVLRQQICHLEGHSRPALERISLKSIVLANTWCVQISEV